MDSNKWNEVMKGNEGPCDRQLLDVMCCSSIDDIAHLQQLHMVQDIPGGGSMIEASPRKRFKLPKLNGSKGSSKEYQSWFNM